MSKNFRSMQINVSTAVYDALKVLADLEGASCPDEVADLRLGLLLSNECEIQWAITERRRLMADFRERHAARIRAKSTPSTATQEAPEPVLPERGAGQSKAHLDDRP